MEEPKNKADMEQPCENQLYVLSKEKAKKLDGISLERIFSQLHCRFYEY